MAFENLPQVAQDLVMTNFYFGAKTFLLLFVFAFSFAYLYYFKERQKPTAFFLVGIIRTLLYGLSFVYVWNFPLLILFVYPQVAFDLLIKFMLVFYWIGFSIFAFVILLNVIYFSPFALIKFAGMDLDNPRINSIVSKMLNKSKDWFVYGENNKGK